VQKSLSLLAEVQHIYAQAARSEDGQRCAVAPAPELKDRLNAALASLVDAGGMAGGLRARIGEPRHLGFNDGVLIPPEDFPVGTSPSVIRSAGPDRSPLRGTVRVIVVLVDFTDLNMAQTQQHFRDLFFSTAVLPHGSVREYYREVTNGLIDIQGDVVGPFRLPQTLSAYAHGASGIGAATPNAQTMARDALLAADPSVNFAPYDNDGNGFVDAFIVIHAGPGAEVSGSSGDIWSHKWTLDGGARTVDSTKVFGYLTVPEDCKIGVCAHELGHLLFGFPDLYDTDNSSEGIGNWCLMAAGSWGGGGDVPVHPSAWCKANQGWAAVDNRTTNATVSIGDVKATHTIYRLWKDGAPGQEYYLVENRQQTGYDASLPGGGLLIWHIDETEATNSDEAHYKVALMQADGRRDLEHNANRGDAGDAFPGTSGNTAFTNSSNPNSKSYANASTCCAVTGISAPGPVMTATLQVRCLKLKEKESVVDKQRPFEKLRIEKSQIPDKFPEKPIIDKRVGFDKGFDNKLGEGKLGEQRSPGGFGGGAGPPRRGRRPSRTVAAYEELLARVERLEAMMQQEGDPSGMESEQSPFIGQDLRPDLSQGALAEEDDQAQLRHEMMSGSAGAKRLYDSKPGG
jgi:immune inhibitor A